MKVKIDLQIVFSLLMKNASYTVTVWKEICGNELLVVLVEENIYIQVEVFMVGCDDV
jgi:hypothetical protein